MNKNNNEFSQLYFELEIRRMNKKSYLELCQNKEEVIEVLKRYESMMEDLVKVDLQRQNEILTRRFGHA